jgi:hypothetical protein
MVILVLLASNAPEIIKWLEKERPEVIEQTKQGIKLAFSK